MFFWGGGGRCPKFETPFSWDSHCTIFNIFNESYGLTHNNDSDRGSYLGVWRSPTAERMRPHLWPSPNLQIFVSRTAHRLVHLGCSFFWESWKDSQISQLGFWHSGDSSSRWQETCAFNVDKWPIHVTFISNTDSKSGVNRDSNPQMNASVLPVLTAKVSAYNSKDIPLKSQVSIHGIEIYIYTWNPNDLYSWRSTPQNQGLFQSKQGASFGF